MTVQDKPAAALAFGSAFSATFGTVFGRLWSFTKAALLPAALFIPLTIAGGVLAATGQPQPLLDILLEIVGLLPLAVFGIACSRLVLIGRQAGAIPRPLFGRRTLVYLGYIVLIGVIMSLPAIAFGIVMMGAAVFTLGTEPEPAQMQRLANLASTVPLLFLFYLVYLYFITRLSLVFPAVAADRKLGLAGSWRLTRGASGFKLYALLIVVVLLCLVGTLIAVFVINTLVAILWFRPGNFAQADGIDWMMVAVSVAPNLILGLLTQLAAFVLIAVAITVAYAQLSGWGAPREEILERFE